MKNKDGMQEIEEELKRRNLPDFMLLDGKKITDAEQWEQKRTQMREAILRELYGFMSFRECSVSAETVKLDPDAYGGKGSHRNGPDSGEHGERRMLLPCPAGYTQRGPKACGVSVYDGLSGHGDCGRADRLPLCGGHSILSGYHAGPAGGGAGRRGRSL